ncbi:putative voltage-gated ClC-type chloride channel ClcB [Pirellula sp. SH-Sr6A]|nr:putative voltage-gated ClC-type chloride channel ClcB [Pirellula sp. SH-Sr6A]
MLPAGMGKNWKDFWKRQNVIPSIRKTIRWWALSAAVGATVGTLVALFLFGLDRVTEVHWQYPWLLYLLPVAGAISAWMFTLSGRGADRGNNLILEEIHEQRSGVPMRMAPLVLLGTWLTHLFGGSAGREGTAVQMGAAIAAGVGRWLRLSREETRSLLLCGVAAGFGSVFGTPVAGAIFAVEFLVNGRLASRPILPCLIASIVGDQVTLLWGIQHTQYVITLDPSIALGLPVTVGAKVVLASVCFGAASVLFAKATHLVQDYSKRWIAMNWLRPFIGGLAIIALVQLLGTRDYLGLGVSAPHGNPNAVTIQSAFQEDGAEPPSWLFKLLFTAITVGSGFKGGEVTPLFFIGATLGHVLGDALGLPTGWMAGLGLVAVFSGATKTPVASTFVAIELFLPHGEGLTQSGFVVYAAIACFVAYAVSGPTSIYHAQRHHSEVG